MLGGVSAIRQQVLRVAHRLGFVSILSSLKRSICLSIFLCTSYLPSGLLFHLAAKLELLLVWGAILTLHAPASRTRPHLQAGVNVT
jgi:hypothetical protein